MHGCRAMVSDSYTASGMTLQGRRRNLLICANATDHFVVGFNFHLIIFFFLCVQFPIFRVSFRICRLHAQVLGLLSLGAIVQM